MESRNLTSLDEQIAALEAQLRGNGSDDDSSGSSGSDDDDSDKGESSEVKGDELIAHTNDQGEVVKLVSTLSSERITPLPTSMLPSIDVRKSGSKREQTDTGKSSRKRSIRFSDEVEDHSTSHSHTKVQKKDASAAAQKNRKCDKYDDNINKSSPSSSSLSSGMENTIREMLSNYTPASSQKLPFYCRICQHQATDESEFYAHKATEYHLMAVNMEKKMTYCKICRKQFTSLVQLQEHLKSSKHKATMSRVMERQSGQRGRERNGIQWS